MALKSVKIFILLLMSFPAMAKNITFDTERAIVGGSGCHKDQVKIHVAQNRVAIFPRLKNQLGATFDFRTVSLQSCQVVIPYRLAAGRYIHRILSDNTYFHKTDPQSEGTLDVSVAIGGHFVHGTRFIPASYGVFPGLKRGRLLSEGFFAQKTPCYAEQTGLLVVRYGMQAFREGVSSQVTLASGKSRVVVGNSPCR